MKRFVAIFFTILCLSPAWADTPIAYITRVSGVVKLAGEEVRLLKPISAGQILEIGSDSKADLAYVKGGMRAEVSGPATLRLEPKGPVMLKGSPEQLSVTVPKRQDGEPLPEGLDIGSGGVTRRATLELHLSRSLEPGNQIIEFFVRPVGTNLRLIVFDYDTNELIFESENPGASAFVIPEGQLLPGEKYEFVLEGPSNQEVVRAATILKPSDTKELKTQLAAQPNDDYSSDILRVGLYSHYGLDQHALEVAQSLLERHPEDSSLIWLRNRIRSLVKYGETQ